MRRAGLLPAAALLAACAQEPVPASPALWKASCGHGGTGWLLGTIHSLRRPADWLTPRIRNALDRSSLIVVEIKDLDDRPAGGRTFARMAANAGELALSRRVPAKVRPALSQVLKRHGLSDDQFARLDTWAAALTIANVAGEADSENGIDRAIIASAGERRILGLEGFEQQLAIFDRLPEKEQRDLLEAVIADAAAPEGALPDLERAWLGGDVETIEQQIESGMLADPELREALLVSRNQAWTRVIHASLRGGDFPFVAVGAAHMLGPDGIMAMLERAGCTVTRFQ